MLARESRYCIKDSGGEGGGFLPLPLPGPLLEVLCWAVSDTPCYGVAAPNIRTRGVLLPGHGGRENLKYIILV